MIVRVENVSYTYRGTVRALRDCSLEVTTGRITGLLGPNGSGKTTLLQLLSRQRRLQSGRVRADGAPDHRAVSIGWAASEALLYDNVRFKKFVEQTYGPALRVAPGTLAERTRYLVSHLGFEEYHGRKPGGFSQGTRMKAAILLAFLHAPQLVVLDEPFNGLDVHTVDRLTSLIRTETRGKDCAVLIADHQVGVLGEFLDDVAFINRGKIGPCASNEALTERHGSLKEAYRRLVSP